MATSRCGISFVRSAFACSSLVENSWSQSSPSARPSLSCTENWSLQKMNPSHNGLWFFSSHSWYLSLSWSALTICKVYTLVTPEVFILQMRV